MAGGVFENASGESRLFFFREWMREMSFNPAKISLPLFLFLAGWIPWIFWISYLFLFNPHLHDPTFVYGGIACISVPPVCFITGIITALRLPGKHRRLGLTINGLPLTVQLLWIFYVWVLN